MMFNVLSQTACNTCKLRGLCITQVLDETSLDDFDRVTKRSRPCKKGEHLFYEGDFFKSLFIIRSGAVKSYLTTTEGEEQIIRFFLPGELLGVSGIGKVNYPFSAMALETAAICEIPYQSLEELSVHSPALKHQIIQVMGRYVREDQQLKILLTKKTVDERIASFLVNLSAKLYSRGFSAYKIHLPFSRNDIGNYLGMNTETVSRVFSRLQKNGIITVNGKEILITDFEALCSTSGSLLATKFINLLNQNTCLEKKKGSLL